MWHLSRKQPTGSTRKEVQNSKLHERAAIQPQANITNSAQTQSQLYTQERRHGEDILAQKD